MTYRMFIEPNAKHIPLTSHIVELCSEHIGDFLNYCVVGYEGDGWVVFKEDENWYLEVDKEENLMYIRLLL